MRQYKTIFTALFISLVSFCAHAEEKVGSMVSATTFLTGKWDYYLDQTEMCAGTAFCPPTLPAALSGRYSISLKLNMKKFKLEGALKGTSPLTGQTQKYKVVSKSYDSVGFQYKGAAQTISGLCTVPTETIFLTVENVAKKIVSVHHRIEWILCGKSSNIWDQADFEGTAQKVGRK